MPAPRRPLFAVAALAAVAGLAAAQPAERPEPVFGLSAEQSAAYLESLAPTNAALLYFQIFMQEDKALSDAYVHFNADEDDDADSPMSREDAEQAFANGQSHLDRFAAAAALPDCDFGLEYQKGFVAMLPHLSKMRHATRILAADARRHLAAGDPDKAAERLATIYRMADHLTGDHVLISSLVSAAMCAHAHEVVTEALEAGALTAPGRDRLLGALARFDAEDPFAMRACVKMEGALASGWLVLTFPEGRAGSRLAEWGIISADDGAMVRRFDSMDGATLRREAERMTEYHRQAFDLWDDPQAGAKLEALGALVEAGAFGELAKGFGAAFGRAKEQSLRAEAALADARAALEAYEPEEEAAPDAAETPAPSGR